MDSNYEDKKVLSLYKWDHIPESMVFILKQDQATVIYQ